MDSSLCDWDSGNIAHLAAHNILPNEVEEVIRNRPVDLGSKLRNGEDRLAQLGETNSGRVLLVVTTTRNKKIRPVTAWPANKSYRKYFSSLKRNGNVGRIEDEDIRK